MRILMVGMIALFMAGCATTTASQQQQQQYLGAIYSQCPPLKTYTKAQRDRAARELRELASDSQLAVLITDYGKLREACRIVNNAVR